LVILGPIKFRPGDCHHLVASVWLVQCRARYHPILRRDIALKQGRIGFGYCRIPCALLRQAGSAAQFGPHHTPHVQRGNRVLSQLQTMQGQLNGNAHLRRLGCLFTETVQLVVDGQEFYLSFDKGALVEISAGPSRKTPWRFSFRTDTDALAEFWQARPAPGFHDIFGLVKIGRGQIEGDILSLVKNLRFFKEFMALPRKEARK